MLASRVCRGAAMRRCPARAQLRAAAAAAPKRRVATCGSDSTAPPDPSTRDLRFAFLNLEGHPRGNAILKHLLSRGLVPSLLLEERSAMAQRGRRHLEQHTPARLPAHA